MVNLKHRKPLKSWQRHAAIKIKIYWWCTAGQSSKKTAPWPPASGCTPGGGTRSEKWWGCAAGRWKLDPKRSREKWNSGPKRSNSVRIGSFNTPKDRFGVGGWEKIPQKDRARSCQSEKRGSKPRHICITHHIGSTPPGMHHQTVPAGNTQTVSRSIAGDANRYSWAMPPQQVLKYRMRLKTLQSLLDKSGLQQPCAFFKIKLV